MKLPVLSYNIHRGFSGTSRKFVLSGIREQIRKIDSDLVFLQEVLGDHTQHRKFIPESVTSSQIEYLSADYYPYHAYGKNRLFSRGHMGNAILSKFPILSSSNLDVSTNRFEKRGVLHVTIDWPGCSLPLHCICVHLNLTGGGRKSQVVTLYNKVLREVPEDEPLIIAGDFNDWASAASRILAEKVGVHEVFKNSIGRHASTFPTQAPILRLDRIYCRGFMEENPVVHSKGIWKKLSDHAAISTDLLLKE